MTTSPAGRTPSASRCLKALSALGISTAGVRTNKTDCSYPPIDLTALEAPAELGHLQAIGYEHAATQTIAELRTLSDLGWVNLDRWVRTELARAMRTAARSVDGVAAVFTLSESRRLAHGAALGRIDMLRAYDAYRGREPDDAEQSASVPASLGGRRRVEGDG